MSSIKLNSHYIKQSVLACLFLVACLAHSQKASAQVRYYRPQSYPQRFQYPQRRYQYPASRYQTPPGQFRYRQPYIRNGVPANYVPGYNGPGYNPGFNPVNPPRTNTPLSQPPSTKQPAVKDTAPPVTAASPSKPEPPKPYNPLPRMVAEFEPQRAIVLSVCDLQSQHSTVLQQIVEQSREHANILILYNDNQQLKSTVDLLEADAAGSLNHVAFLQLELDTVWLRDFGPRISEDADGFRALDFYYYGVRPFDDSFPERWALDTGGKMTKIPWTIQGGNLIANGTGVGVTTSKIYEENHVSFPGQRSPGEGREFLVKQMRELCNLKELVVLKPLTSESTKHVDMYATFVAEDHILIAELDPRQDRLNAQILNDNARRMAAVKVDGEPMQVSRIRIPRRDGQAWSTYTNSIITDRLVLVPKMKSDPPALVSAAVAKYKELFPEHHVAIVDITSMKQLQGSLHCMSLNLPEFAPLPDGAFSFAKAVSRVAGVPKETEPRKPVSLIEKYTMDKQLRRIFKSDSSDFLLDAYAVALAGDVVDLVRVDDLSLIHISSPRDQRGSRMPSSA